MRSAGLYRSFRKWFLEEFGEELRLAVGLQKIKENNQYLHLSCLIIFYINLLSIVPKEVLPKINTTTKTNTHIV